VQLTRLNQRTRAVFSMTGVMKEPSVTHILYMYLFAIGISPLNSLCLNRSQCISQTKFNASPRSKSKCFGAPPTHAATKMCTSSSARSLTRISESPLAFVDEAFLDASECAELIHLAKSRSEAGYHDVAIKAEDSELLTSMLSRVSILCASESHPDEAKPNIRNTPPILELNRGRLMNRGLHLDTNGNPFRYATALVYLSDVKADGATVFPCSEPSKVDIRAAGKALVDKEQTIAARRRRGDKEVEAAEKELIDAAECMRGLSVYPKAGKLLLFYTLCDDGSVDPSSWHGGAAVGNEDGEGKWLLQIFKTIPVGERTPEKIAQFVHIRRHLHDEDFV